MWSGLRSRRWRVRAVACLVMVAGLACAAASRPALAGLDGDQSTQGRLGKYPNQGSSLDTYFDANGTWRDGWCRRGEGYAIVIDLSSIPESWRGDLTPTPEHVKQYGPTVREGWIVRCHQGMYGAHVPASQNKFSKIDWDAALESVGLSTYYTSDYLEPSDNAIEINNSSEKEVLHVRPLQEKQTIANHWGWNGVVWFRPDAAGDLSGGWPPNRTPVNGPWPSLGTGNRMLPQDRGLIEKDSVVDGAIAYIVYEKMQDMRFCTDNDNSVPMAYHVCLGDAALHPRTHYDPKTHQPCLGWTLTPQYADGTVNGCIPKSPPGPAPKPDPHPGSHHRHGRSPAHGGSSGGGHGPGVHHGPAIHRGGSAGHAGRRDVAGAHAGVSARRGKAPYARLSARPSASASSSVSRSASPSPSTSVSRSAFLSPSASASAGGSRVWGSERQGPTASSDHRDVPGWAWGASGAVLVAAGVLMWWLMRGRHHRREDDEIDSGDVE